MKSVLIVFLIGLVIFLSFSSSALRKELLNAREDLALLEERNNQLHKELRRLGMLYRENEQFLNELEQGVRELESKMPFATLKRYIPKQVLKDIKPIIDRLQVLQDARNSRIPSDEEKHQD